MKKLIMFSMLIAIAVPVFSGIASAQVEPVCIQVCPTDAGPGDEVTLTAIDENGDQVDLTEWTGGVESNFAGCDPLGFFDQADPDGTVTFELTECWYNNEAWDFFIFVPGGDGWGSYMIAGGDSPNANVIEAIAAGGTCEGLGCDTTLPAITVDSNDIYEPQDAGGPPAEGNQRDLLWVSLAWRPGEPTYPAFTAYVKVDPNEGDAPHEDFTFINPPPDPNGNVYLTYDETNWDVPQYVTVEAVADLDREGNESYTIELTVTINIADPNFGNPTPVVVTSSVGVVDNDVPYVSAIPGDIDLSESDPCCVELKIRLSHKPTDNVYVRIYTEEWAFEEEMVYIDPPLEPEEGPVEPNVLTFTTVNDQDPCEATMTSGWNVEQTITVCPIDNDWLTEAWTEFIGGDLWIPAFSEDVRYRVPWLSPDGSPADDPCTPEEEEESGGELEEEHVSITVQDNECGAQGYAPRDFSEDCRVGLSDFARFYTQWLICTEPYDNADEYPVVPSVCDKLWILVPPEE